ncbi:hypothetical protein ACF07Y_14460 [Streptomyces sp. NPDC016566]|uniref:hypothetical protein n=1 Tax=Streptomyces sp. NPDC016566 TaxID=3364967 RepID=UPI00370255BE
MTATDNSGIKDADEFSLKGPDYGFETTGKPTCAVVNATTSTCTASVTIDPRTDYFRNKNTGTWYVDAWVNGNDDDFIQQDKAGSAVNATGDFGDVEQALPLRLRSPVPPKPERFLSLVPWPGNARPKSGREALLPYNQLHRSRI